MSALKALIVEDSPLLMLDLEYQLRDLGFTEIELACDVKTGLEIVARGADMHIAIVDYVLGDENSNDLVEVLQTSNTPFVIYTGHAREEIIKKYPAARYIAKPSKDDEFKIAIAELMKRNRTAMNTQQSCDATP